ncbi:DNA topoisomerase [Desulfuromonas soudanensis]|uniref:DNA topoisomerase n=1 Tax=Desulfuromonas soudanensis TaxID=1603606 RepID=A0A0M4D393_9BACT|nr:four helix bundle suffix domain-containing protein [Desulfuromonas soudanensis]ALC17621.1 DNA topoisomerase [Desulfuromonas soudanensis]
MAATSSQTELRLVNVARASLDELLLDYEDFLRQRGKRQWTKDDAEAKAVREVGKRLEKDPTNRSDVAAYAAWLRHSDPAVFANALICLIHQANYLLDQQIAGLERSFVNDGGYSEQLAAARVKRRNYPTDPSDEKPALPACPLCSKPLVLRTAKQGKNAGSQFLGCSGYLNVKAPDRLMNQFDELWRGGRW